MISRTFERRWPSPVPTPFCRLTSLFRSPSCQPSLTWLCRTMTRMDELQENQLIVVFSDDYGQWQNDEMATSAIVELPWQRSRQTPQGEEVRGWLWCRGGGKQPFFKEKVILMADWHCHGIPPPWAGRWCTCGGFPSSKSTAAERWCLQVSGLCPCSKDKWTMKYKSTGTHLIKNKNYCR